MRYCYSLLLVLSLSITVSAEAYRGFLLTKDDYHLTGYFNLIEYSPTGNYITFTNDFGDVYAISPQLVKGFGFSEGDQTVRFISRYHEGQWFFLREVVPGRVLSLFSMPNGNDRYVDDTMLRLFTNPPAPFWFEYGKGNLMPINRVGYKKTLRTFFTETNPGLAKRIGKKGYRYRDLHNIVAEYNVTTAGRKRRRL
ncbi:hypothetical protein [Lewinella sp. 4G2]|uniref:hypothetical protein n=1 Tax=Lewinella sp. 4G2 TaxID=1803372 RepID=UPI0007B481B8|nr:hypothetical protein [Lewinella sp. 4G2]OAV42593.1 hypothetical protein A3850_015210 [Lewinella sp. 4G2]